MNAESGTPSPSSNRPRPSVLAWRNWFDEGEPYLYSGPLARHPRATDAVIALIVFGISLVTVSVSALGDGEDFGSASISELPAGAFILLALAAGSLLGRRHRPIATTGVVLAVLIVWALAGYGDGQDLALIAATYGIGRYATNRTQGLATLAGAVAVAIIGTAIDANQRIDIAPALIFTVLPWYVGRRVRNRGDYLALLQDRAERLEAEQQARARQAVADERSRIARELHDVVAHRVSMMTVQAGAAKTVARNDLEAAIESMGDVEQAGRQALGELRHLLGVLRTEIDDSENPAGDGPSADGLIIAREAGDFQPVEDLGPQPGMTGVAALAEQLTQTGAEVSVSIANLPDALPAALSLSLYRIVQESFTNIIKHAGPGPTVDLTINPDQHDLVIEITNTISSTDAASAALSDPLPELSDFPNSGYGIVGMAERATILGGTLTAAPLPPGRFRVSARLPLSNWKQAHGIS